MVCLFGLKERKMNGKKLWKLTNELVLTLVQILLLISVIFFIDFYNFFFSLFLSLEPIGQKTYYNHLIKVPL
jgi:hypothetical protein